MEQEKFLENYNESRNGANQFFFHPSYKRFHYSDGMKECFETGCYWLLDLFATELPKVFKDAEDGMLLILNVQVKDDNSCSITGGLSDDQTDYTREIEYTDLPKGQFTFYVFKEDDILRAILPNEY